MGIFKEGFDTKIILAVVLVIALAVVFIYSGQKEKVVTNTGTQAAPVSAANIDSSEISVLEKNMEERIATNLASIKGVGKTKVLVTYTSSLKKEYANDKSVTNKTSKETDKDGGTRETVEVTETNQLVLANSSPVIVAEQCPQVAGVLVIAQGASDPKIKEQIFEAVKTLLNIQPSKISVAPLGGV